jgi:caa(3)-type oxidase subunit IV
MITVGVSYIHLPTVPAVTLCLLIATVKASLVACFFMHLISEKKIIYWVMGLSVLFFLFELLIPMINETHNLNMGG